MRRCDIKKRYTDRIELGEEVLGMLLEYLDFNRAKIKPLSRKVAVHYNTLYSFIKGKTLPKNSVLFKIQHFINSKSLVGLELKNFDEIVKSRLSLEEVVEIKKEALIEFRNEPHI